MHKYILIVDVCYLQPVNLFDFKMVYDKSVNTANINFVNDNIELSLEVSV